MIIFLSVTYNEMIAKCHRSTTSAMHIIPPPSILSLHLRILSPLRFHPDFLGWNKSHDLISDYISYAFACGPNFRVQRWYMARPFRRNIPYD